MKSFIGSLFSLLAANTVLASNAQPSINWWHLGSDYKDAPALGWLTITFGVFVYLIARMVHKPLSLYLETRSKDIKRQIEEGQRAKALSEEKVRHYEEKLKSLGQEIHRLKEAFSEQAEAEKEERDQKLIEMEKRILQDADDNIKSNFERTKNRLADEVVKKALALAQETIATNKSADSFLQDAFIHDLKSVGKDGRNDVRTADRAALRKRPHLIS
jgi:F0F1-type ATP synthase membrane subunit b/b'